MKVEIKHERDGWRFEGEGMASMLFASYGDAVGAAKAAGHEIGNAGWLHRMLMWNWHAHALEGFPGWEIEHEGTPAFVKLSHVRGKGPVESHKLAAAWDDVAEVDFYQRDWTKDGVPTVRQGDTYWSGWWFATLAERDRFLAWHVTVIR